MSDAVISTIFDILNNDKNNIARRYMGNFEFSYFKAYLARRRYFYLLIYILMGILSFTFLIHSIRVLYINLLDFILIKIIFDSSMILLSFAFLFLSINNFLIEIRLMKYYKLKSFELIKRKGMKWSKWDFCDIILENPIKFDKKLFFDSDKNYVLYLICQYSDGNFGWLKLTNNKKLKRGNKNKWDESIKEDGKVSHFEKGLFLTSNNVNLAKLKRFMKRNKIYPELIIGFRVRSDIENNSVVIKNFDLK